MARKPRTTKAPETTNKFLDALKFCQLVLSDKGTPVETHLVLNNKTAIAFNGIIAAGHLIDEDIYAAPNNKLMIEALSKCGQNLSIVQLDNNRISIKSEKFKAIVPGLDPTSLPSAYPDNLNIAINNELKKAIEVVGVLANEDGQAIYNSSILIRNGSALSTNGYIIFEYWHGLELPTIALPKAFVDPVVKSVKDLSGFGHSDYSATFWFQDNSWIRSQLYRDQWPEVDHFLNKQAHYFNIPEGFWDGLAAIAPFSQDGLCYFDNELIKSHADANVGATYEVAGLPKGPIFNIKNLMMIKPYAKIIDFVVPHGDTLMLMFQGDNIRGCMLGRK
jgi:hypothetical protein